MYRRLLPKQKNPRRKEISRRNKQLNLKRKRPPPRLPEKKPKRPSRNNPKNR